MRPAALAALRSPRTGAPLALDIATQADGHVVEGVLRTGEDWYPVIGGLPIFPSEALRPDLTAFAARHGLTPPAFAPDASGQSVTNETFSDKWRRFRNYGLEPEHKPFLQGWYAKKFGLAGVEELPAFYNRYRRILEVGPGSGFHSLTMAEMSQAEIFACDISDGADTSYANTAHHPRVHVVKADLFAAPFADDSFDFIVADGVLHHTPSTRGALNALWRKLAPGGDIFFYVYRKMGAARQFVDAHVREAFTKLTPEQCYEACEAITELGRALSQLNATITLDRPIPVLGLPAGAHDVQRFFYYGFMKCFWNDAFDFETNNMVNFDWYHPHHAWQQTQEEVEAWLDELGATNVRINDANPNGISVLATKPA